MNGRGPVRVLAAHGTSDGAGRTTVVALAEAVAERIGPVRLAWLDVLTPDLATVLSDISETGDSAVVVPALLSDGYHGRSDIPAVIAERAPQTRLAPVLGDDPRLVQALAGRLVEAGWAGEPVILAATGSTRPEWHALRGRVADALSQRLGVPVHTAVAAGPGTPVEAVLAGLRDAGFDRIAISAHLLAEGYFWDRMAAAGAAVTARPLGAHPALVELLADRFGEVGQLSAPTAAS